MRLHFTKMQGAGNDFVVLDATRAPLALSAADYRFLGDRRFGVGADQILVVERSTTPGVDFRYRIFNGGSGDEVEQCGNGARCFARFVRDNGLSQQVRVKVETVNSLIELHVEADGRVTVDMNQPIFEHALIPFDSAGLSARPHNGHGNGFELWPLQLPGASLPSVDVAVLSMGNPHAVQRVHDVDTAPVAEIGPRVETHARFPRHVNAGFMQVMSRREVRLRVFERGAGETLACGTGACAAVVAGIRLGWLDPEVDVQTRGGLLTIAWAGLGHPVLMTGPAQTVFTGDIDLPTTSVQ
ncbi:Diaminopimelate epimerase [Leptothrix cholodnii SP-6]|uniref:Diaminopimelate epimerase n=1 Tax=Leptothrix cholodnii (strain ATCC 51168 / LMG 8142 / SP-6) TaxID=395495 RepID=DAPF_LEPCP|nr:diaminopimelate epimerase [Leptothrix cholodnii]B1Y6S6.1 RecName: Full=Diaminopimelate epimerase; Short=DAP epimerase; AltName: Full=PLP-independent amino acid racemase [Leptothrix cholodnii SP-6]ACB32404.1 Diaminopimelate epimerase [Leptothrix cholodnii SP-6]